MVDRSLIVRRADRIRDVRIELKILGRGKCLRGGQALSETLRKPVVLGGPG